MGRGDGGYDIGSILENMREEYWLGLAEEEESPKELLECLLFTLGGRSFAFETHYAREVIRIPKLARVPSVPDFVCGIFNLRGEVTAAVDIRPLLSLEQPQLTESGRVVVIKSERFATGILVERALGVGPLSFDGFTVEEDQPLIRGSFQHEDESVLLLDLAALLASPELMIGDF